MNNTIVDQVHAAPGTSADTARPRSLQEGVLTTRANPIAAWVREARDEEHRRLVALARERERLEQGRARFAAD
jgi:hypothetical protein